MRFRGSIRGGMAPYVVAGALWVLAVSPLRGAAPGYQVSRANLAKTASFTVTTTTAPTGGSKVSRAMRVEVKGDKARIESDDPRFGSVTYLANGKGVYLYVPANKLAQKQSFTGGVDAFLRRTFEQVNQRLKTAKKISMATVSGQMTDVYKDGATGALLYIGRSPGFRLPIKMVLHNEGGSQTVLVTNIKTGISLPDERFAVPAGVKIIEDTGAPGGPGAGR